MSDRKYGESEEDYQTRIRNEKAAKDSSDFSTSLALGMALNNGPIAGAIGGSMIGGMLGDMMTPGGMF